MTTLAPFSIIVAVDAGNGIAKNGAIPWSHYDTFFRDTTMGRTFGKNAVIMGRNTYEKIPKEHRPLEGRKCFVITRTWKQEEHPEIRVCASLGDALAGVGSNLKSYNDVFVAGGEDIYREAIEDYLYLCKHIYVTKFKTDYGCDQFFPFDAIKSAPLAADPTKTKDYTRYHYAPEVEHDEYQYLKELERVATTGDHRSDGTLAVFGNFFVEFDVRDRMPLLTTRRLFVDQITKELLWWLSGSTNLAESGLKTPDDAATRERLEALGLYPGDAGPHYGHQWRHFGPYGGMAFGHPEARATGQRPEAPRGGMDRDRAADTDPGFDQLRRLVDELRTNPHSTFHLITSWNPTQSDRLVVEPEILTLQFNVSGDRRWLDCFVNIRSTDVFVTLPNTIAQIALLTAMIAHITTLRPRKISVAVANAFVKDNQGQSIDRLLKRTPRPFPKLDFRDKTRIHALSDFRENSFIFENYTSWQVIT